jgi:hypothetical protein
VGLIKRQPDISFELNGKQIAFDSMAITTQPFCGETIYSISSAKGKESFLISIVTDTLRPASYVTGFNYWYPGGGITSSFMKVSITKSGATFNEDSLHLRNGIIAHQF